MWADLYSQSKELQEMSLLALKLLGTADGPKVRGKLQEGNAQYSVYDFMTHVCQYGDNGNAARKEFCRLIQDGSEYKQEVAAMCHYLKFPGKGQKETPSDRTLLRGQLALSKAGEAQLARSEKASFDSFKLVFEENTSLQQENARLQQENAGLRLELEVLHSIATEEQHDTLLA